MPPVRERTPPPLSQCPVLPVARCLVRCPLPQDELFPVSLFEQTLGEHDERLRLSGVEQVTIHCKFFNCRALTTTTPGRRLRVTVPLQPSPAPGNRRTPSGAPLLRYDACSAQYGALLSRLGACARVTACWQ